MEKHDLVIIGSGPGGLSAAIYAARYNVDVIVIGEIPGGIAGTANDIRNYPGFQKTSGMELMTKMVDQVKNLDVPIYNEVVTGMKKETGGIIVKTSKKEYLGKKIIIATGTDRRKLGLNNEKELIGKGVSYCATCDAGFYKDKTVGIVGGGDAALTASILLAKFAKKIYLIYRKDKFTKAEPAWVDEIEKLKNIEIMFNEEVTELIGVEKLEKVKLKSGKDLELNGLFIEIGGTPNIELAQEIGLELENGSIVVDKNQKTNVEGVFAAGDVTNRPFKQIVSAAGDGATACYTAYKELEKGKDKD